MPLIDTHTHLDSFARRGELPVILARAREAAVEEMIGVGTEPGDWKLYRGLAREHAGVVHYTVGLHPCSVDDHWAAAMAQLEGFWQSDTGLPARGGVPMGREAHATDKPLPVAVGEIGLDRFHLPKDAAQAERIFDRQRAAFAAGLETAKRVGAPIVIHSRGAFRECVEMIDAAGCAWSRVVFHCFSEGPAEMAELTKRGGRGSFTGIITYKNAEAVRAAAKAQGIERLMIETDAPYLAPEPHRGRRNEPAFVRHTAEFCARLFGVTDEELAAITTANAKAFFNLSS
ncbi:MAG: hydrolase TatD [Verrucomicrobia bacterium RIFCSPLOWO2_12_FULL_64_8]|nr:MAG: hydrolase TatD [Verrucomicrobia bacterium RIFCSPLOWO2_12_FULL_64_8]